MGLEDFIKYKIRMGMAEKGVTQADLIRKFGGSTTTYVNMTKYGTGNVRIISKIFKYLEIEL